MLTETNSPMYENIYNSSPVLYKKSDYISYVENIYRDTPGKLMGTPVFKAAFKQQFFCSTETQF